MNDAIQSPDNQISETTPQENDGIKFSIAEYSALRDEILKRTEVQHQILLLTITALGAFLSNSSKAAITAIGSVSDLLEGMMGLDRKFVSIDK
jgi:hypothetical protein